jgi:hypothetical protein
MFMVSRGDFTGEYNHDMDEMLRVTELASQHRNADKIEKALAELTLQALIIERELLTDLF